MLQTEEADTPAEDAEVSQTQEVQEEETSQAVEQSEAQPEAAAESEVAAQEAKTDKAEAKVQTAENEIAVQDASATEEEKAAAAAYLKENFLPKCPFKCVLVSPVCDRIILPKCVPIWNYPKG